MNSLSVKIEMYLCNLKETCVNIRSRNKEDTLEEEGMRRVVGQNPPKILSMNENLVLFVSILN